MCTFCTVQRGLYYLGGRVLLLAPKDSLFEGGGLRSKDGGSFPAATPVDIPSRWDPNTKKEPTGLFFAACGPPCFFDSSYGLQVAATTVDVPSRWDPRANQSPTGALVTVLCTAALFDSSYGLQVAVTPVDIPSRWDPRTKQQSAGLLFATYRWPCSFDSRTGHEKNPPSECSRDFMTRTGIEPMLQP